MGIFNFLFGKSAKQNPSPQTKRVEDMTEEEKTKEVIRFIQVNAEGDDGDPKYQLQYGYMFFTGQGPGGRGAFTKDLDQAIYWISKSAAQGNVDATCILGRVYMEKGDFATARKCFREAAEKGDVDACENLALAYGTGDGVAEDKVEAHKWFLKAAELGSAFSQYVVGQNLFDGTGVQANPGEAMGWFEKAANQGQENAQFMMGQLFEFGHHDIETACEWYAKAAAQGLESAQERLRELGR